MISQQHVLIIKKCLDLGEDTWKISIWIWFFFFYYFRVCSSFHVHYNSVGSMRSSVTNDKTEKFSWSSLFIHSFFKLTYNHTAVQESLILFLVCFTFFIYVHESWVTPFHGSCFGKNQKGSDHRGHPEAHHGWKQVEIRNEDIEKVGSKNWYFHYNPDHDMKSSGQMDKKRLLGITMLF